MIVDSMTDLELLAEVMKDKDEFDDFYVSVCQNKAYKKRLQWGRPKDGQFKICINDWKSKRGNVYTFIIKTTGWNEFKNGNVWATTLTFFKRNNVQNAIRFFIDKKHQPGIEIFTSHFIDRYNQRFLKQPGLSHKEVVLRYIDQNLNSVIYPLKNSKYDYNVMLGVKDGYILGKYETDSIVVNKTFVTREMLFGGQYDIGDFLDEAVINSLNGGDSNIFDFNEQLADIISVEKDLPTMEELEEGLELLDKYKEKQAALERAGKEFDLEMHELQNKIFLWGSKFDLTKGQLKDEDGNIYNHPLMKELSQFLKKSNITFIPDNNQIV